MAGDERYQATRLDAFAALIDQFSEPHDLAATAATWGDRFYLRDNMYRVADVDWA